MTNHMRMLILTAVVQLPLIVLAADYTYEWKPNEFPSEILDGKVKFIYTGETPKTIRAMTAAPDEGGKITFTGAPMKFTTSETYNYLTNQTVGTVVFQNVVTSRVFVCNSAASCPTRLTWNNNGVAAFIPSSEYRTVFVNVDIKDITPMFGIKQLKAGNFGNSELTMSPCHVVREPGRIECQYHSSLRTVGTSRRMVIVVRLELKQVGADVQARVIAPTYSVYSDASAPLQPCEFDVDEIPDGPDKEEMPVRQSGALNGGYGLNAITVLRHVFTYRIENAAQLGSSKPCEGVRLEIADIANLNKSSFSNTMLNPQKYGEVAFTDASATIDWAKMSAGNAVGNWTFETTRKPDDSSVTNTFTMTSGNWPITGPFYVRGVAGGPMVMDVMKPCLPTGSTVNVESGGILRLRCDGSNNAAITFTNASDIIVGRGGILEQWGKNVFGTNYRVVLNGGMLRVGVTATEADGHAGTDLSRLTMKGGSRLVNGGNEDLRIGHFDSGAVWNIAGSSPSTNEVRIQFYGPRFACVTNRFNVSRTGDYDADFVFNNGIGRYPGSSPFWTNSCEKVGHGTMLLNGTYSVPGELILRDGVFKFGVSNVLSTDPRELTKVVFAGGGLMLAAGTSNAVQLQPGLEADSQIVIEEDASISFPKLTSNAWAVGKTLSITIPRGSKGELLGSVRFGIDETGLSAAQLKQVRLNGRQAYIDGAGYIVQGGLILVVR